MPAAHYLLWYACSTCAARVQHVCSSVLQNAENVGALLAEVFELPLELRTPVHQAFGWCPEHGQHVLPERVSYCGSLLVGDWNTDGEPAVVLNHNEHPVVASLRGLHRGPRKV